METAILNAHFLYSEVNEKKISIREFREEVVTYLLNYSNDQEKEERDVQLDSGTTFF